MPGLNRYDVYEVLVPVILRSDQLRILTRVEPLEKQISQLKSQIIDPLMVINEVFAEEFGHVPILWLEYGKGMTAGTQKSYDKKLNWYNVNFNHIYDSFILRFSARFHNPIAQKLNRVLHKKSILKVKDIIMEPIHRGVQPKAKPEGEIICLKTGQLKNGYLDISECDMVSREFYEKNQRAHVKSGDVLIASTGKVSLGKVDVLDFEEEAIVDGHISIVRINESKYDRWFFTYFFRSILGAFQIERDYTGATNQIELYANQIEKFDIPDTPLSYQTAIAERIKTELDKQKGIEKQIAEKYAEISQLIENSIGISA